MPSIARSIAEDIAETEASTAAKNRGADRIAATIDRLHTFIASHGFQSWTYSGQIEISIPATRRLPDGTIQQTEIIERCEPTLSAVRRALGY